MKHGAGICIIVVAAGTGSRYGADVPKQFVELQGRPVVMVTIERLKSILPQADMILVISREMAGLWNDLCARHGFISPCVVWGGATRGESVGNAVSVLPDNISVVGVHDGVRPLVSAGMVDAALAAIESGVDGAVPCVPVVQSLRRRTHDGWTPVDRSEYVAVQTPQFFRASALCDAYRRLDPSGYTDDASMLDAIGYGDVVMTPGDSHNIKITHPLDVEVAALYLGGLQ